MPVWNGQDLSWADYNAAVNNSGLGDAPRNPDGTVQTTVSTSGTPAQAAILNAGTAATGIGPSGQVGQGITAPAPPADVSAAQVVTAPPAAAAGSPAAAPAAPAANTGTALGGVNLSADFLRALVGQIDSAAAGAVAQSNLRGVVMRPTFNPDGSWGYEPVMGADGQPLRTQAAQLNEAQMTELAARTALSLATASGRVRDPQTGAWMQTPEALRTAALTDLARAQTTQTAAEAAYTSGARTALTNAQAQQAQAEAAFRAGPQTALTNAQAALEQANTRRADIDAAVARATATGTYTDPVTGQSVQTLQAQRQAVELELTRAQTAYQQARVGLEAAQLTGTYQGQTTLAAQQQAFQQQQAVAAAAANPRNYLEASFLTSARGGLGGQAPTNALAATTTAQANAAPTIQGTGIPPTGGVFTVPTPQRVGILGEQRGGTLNPLPAASTPVASEAGGVGQTGQAERPAGTPGAADHLATLQSPGGAQLHFFQAPTGADSIPLSAATRALLENRSIPTTGAIQGPGGGYVSGGQFRQAFNPNQINSRDLANLAPSERAQYEAAGSYAGYSPEDLAHYEQQGRPGFRAPSVGVIG